MSILKALTFIFDISLPLLIIAKIWPDSCKSEKSIADKKYFWSVIKKKALTATK